MCGFSNGLPGGMPGTLGNTCTKSCFLRYPRAAARLATTTESESRSGDTLRTERMNGYFQTSTPARWLAHRFWGQCNEEAGFDSGASRSRGLAGGVLPRSGRGGRPWRRRRATVAAREYEGVVRRRYFLRRQRLRDDVYRVGATLRERERRLVHLRSHRARRAALLDGDAALGWHRSRAPRTEAQERVWRGVRAALAVLRAVRKPDDGCTGTGAWAGLDAQLRDVLLCRDFAGAAAWGPARLSRGDGDIRELRRAGPLAETGIPDPQKLDAYDHSRVRVRRAVCAVAPVGIPDRRACSDRPGRGGCGNLAGNRTSRGRRIRYARPRVGTGCRGDIRGRRHGPPRCRVSEA